MNRIGRGWGWRLIDAVPIRDETFALARALAVLRLPARFADVQAAKVLFLIEKQGVIILLVGKRFAASGARSLFTSGALQRQFRDAHAVNSHLAFNFDAAGTNYGRVALGLPSENLTL